MPAAGVAVPNPFVAMCRPALSHQSKWLQDLLVKCKADQAAKVCPQEQEVLCLALQV